MRRSLPLCRVLDALSQQSLLHPLRRSPRRSVHRRWPLRTCHHPWRAWRPRRLLGGLKHLRWGQHGPRPSCRPSPHGWRNARRKVHLAETPYDTQPSLPWCLHPHRRMLTTGPVLLRAPYHQQRVCRLLSLRALRHCERARHQPCLPTASKSQTASPRAQSRTSAGRHSPRETAQCCQAASSALRRSRRLGIQAPAGQKAHPI